LTPRQELQEVSGIDIRIPSGIRDNSFRDAKTAKLAEAGAYEFLEVLQKKLVVSGFNCRKFETAADMRFHPGEANGYLALIVKIASLDFNIQLTASKRISIQLIFTKSTLDGYFDQMKLLKYLGLEAFRPRANMKYAWLEYGVKYTDYEQLLSRLFGIRDVLTANQSG
jgi:hypothetical protein